MQHAILAMMIALMTIGSSGGDEPKKDVPAPKKDPAAQNPHNVTLTYYLSSADGKADADAIVAALKKVKSAKDVNTEAQGAHVVVTFDSHAVSYHQVAQAIADAGTDTGKKYDPRLKIIVPEYSKDDNAKWVDPIFAAKRLNQRVHIEPVDKTKGEFLIHFLPLKIDASIAGPQGYNGGHLNHPISDAPPRGLGLKFIYYTEPAPKK